jgi:hypothetical protein
MLVTASAREASAASRDGFGEGQARELLLAGMPTENVSILLRHSSVRITERVSVSNSLSGRHWELDQVPAVADPTHVVQLDVGDRVSAGEGQRRVALQ